MVPGLGGTDSSMERAGVFAIVLGAVQRRDGMAAWCPQVGGYEPEGQGLLLPASHRITQEQTSLSKQVRYECPSQRNAPR